MHNTEQGETGRHLLIELTTGFPKMTGFRAGHASTIGRVQEPDFAY